MFHIVLWVKICIWILSHIEGKKFSLAKSSLFLSATFWPNRVKLFRQRILLLINAEMLSTDENA